MNKIEKEIIEKAAARYGKRLGDKLWTNPKNFQLAFMDGIAWYKRNREKIEEAVAMEEGIKILRIK